MRQWPRGLRRLDIDYWVQDAAPSQELLNAYREGLASWDEFTWWYETEQACRESCRVVQYRDGELRYSGIVDRSPLQILNVLSVGYEKVTLLCWENSEFCHRHTLKSLLDEHETAISL
jgi:uncharacterized protein YeaO (DUF488 family)